MDTSLAGKKKDTASAWKDKLKQIKAFDLAPSTATVQGWQTAPTR